MICLSRSIRARFSACDCACDRVADANSSAAGRMRLILMATAFARVKPAATIVRSLLCARIRTAESECMETQVAAEECAAMGAAQQCLEAYPSRELRMGSLKISR